ncbi:zf-HC2 domain-containing protein [Streptomyces sp. NPDC056683]|uniref:zf-HC2 domain-containing protein n=1 Tax=Streptomyces sp. NPDC056683 TaxID=3345910 RepID=UPI0036765D50
MSGDAHCAKLREAGAELALGVLPGRERAEAVAHLDGCADCREYVRRLTGIGDRLIGLLPESDPPPGFETRVARSLAEQAAGAEGARRPAYAAQFRRGRVRRLRLRLAAVAATAAVAVGFAGWAIGSAVEGAVTASPPAVASEPMLAGDMIPAGGGEPVGEIYAHPGIPAWMFVSVALPGTPYKDRVTCLLARADGTTTRIGDFPLRGGRGNWGVAVPVDLTRYSAARLTSADGTLLATAQLQKGEMVTPQGS